MLRALTISPVTLPVTDATLLVLVTLLVLPPAARAAVEDLLDRPEAIVEHAGSSAMYVVGFAATTVAYRGFAGALTPLLEAFGIAGYHLSFLLIGLLALSAFASRLNRCWRLVTDVLTTYVLYATGQSADASPPPPIAWCVHTHVHEACLCLFVSIISFLSL